MARVVVVVIVVVVTTMTTVRHDWYRGRAVMGQAWEARAQTSTNPFEGNNHYRIMSADRHR